MTPPLISPDWTFALWGAIIAVSALGFWLDTTKIGRRLSGVALLLIISMALSNAGVIPHAAPAYETIWQFMVPVAIPLLLLDANLRKIFSTTGPMLGAFALGVIGTLAGAVIGFILVPIGPSAADLTGMLSATYIGGSLNFVAVAEVLEQQNKSFLAAALAADNVVGTTFIIYTALLPSIAILRKWIPSAIADSAEQARSDTRTETHAVSHLNLIHISIALSISLFSCALGYSIAYALNIANYAILFVTLITLVIANIFHRRIEKLSGYVEIALLIMFAFFVTIGAGTELRILIESGPKIFLLAMIIVLVHTAVILAGAKLFRIDLAETVIASLACVGGPAVPAVIAPARGWHALTAPGIMCGILGYAIATFLGVALTHALM